MLKIQALLDAVDQPGRPVPRTWSCSLCSAPCERGYNRCEPCIRNEVAERRTRLSSAARESVPVYVRDAKFGTPQLRSRITAGDEAAYRRVVAVAYQWARDPQGVLLLLGASGQGKTTLAGAVANHLLVSGTSWDSTGEAFERARKMLWTDSFELATAEKYHALGHGMAPLLENAARASVLFVDELGAEKDGLGSEQIYQQVLHRREERRLPSAFTSPLTREALAAKYGGGGERRLLERATVVQL